MKNPEHLSDVQKMDLYHHKYTKQFEKCQKSKDHSKTSQFYEKQIDDLLSIRTNLFKYTVEFILKQASPGFFSIDSLKKLIYSNLQNVNDPEFVELFSNTNNEVVSSKMPKSFQDELITSKVPVAILPFSKKEYLARQSIGVFGACLACWAC